jgi:hypothetical protein
MLIDKPLATIPPTLPEPLASPLPEQLSGRASFRVFAHTSFTPSRAGGETDTGHSDSTSPREVTLVGPEDNNLDLQRTLM